MSDDNIDKFRRMPYAEIQIRMKDTDEGRWPNISRNVVTKPKHRETEDDKRQG